ncbi:MAG: MFS transporter [Bacteroidales bacterium]|jgi:fucose permease|nr:MFS transporter [Bacteroidales bacterium]
MENKKTSIMVILPVMFGFFVMGFVDIIGMTINYVSADFTNLSASVVSLLASSCFIWFLIASIPTGLLMNRIGRKKTVLLSFLVQILAFLLVFIKYDYITTLIAFSLLGIGNTILQVAMNPLVSDVVPGDKLTGTLTIGQLVKAVCSLTGPIFVSWFASATFGDWKVIFPVYALITLLGFIWLMLTKVEEEKIENADTTTFATSLRLFSDKYILAFFIGILVLVGADVGVNTCFPKYLQDTCGLDLNEAALGNSVYFFTRTVGALIGGILLMKVSESKFFNISVIVALVGLAGLIVFRGYWSSMIFVSVFGLGYSNLFAIIFSMALKRRPDRVNDVSALLVMGVAGGGVLPPIMGLITQTTGNQWSAILVIAIVWLYLFALMGRIKNVSTK